MSKVLSLIFTEDFFAGCILQDGQIQLLEVEGFQLLPLYFEVKNDSLIYPISKNEFETAQGRTVFGNYFQQIDGNTTFSLYGSHYALVTIITHLLDRMKEKYKELTGNYHAEQLIPVILTLPINSSGRAKDRLKDFINKRGFKIVQETSLSKAIKLNYNNFSKIAVIDALGKTYIEFATISDNDQYSEKIYEFDEAGEREIIAKALFYKALENSFSALVHDEQSKENELKRYIPIAREWINTLKLKQEVNVHLTFPDGYAGSAFLTKREADDLLIDTTLILNKIRTLQDRVQAGVSPQRIILLGEKLHNFALLTALQQQFGGDKIFQLTEDVKAVQEAAAGVLLLYQKQFQDSASTQIQKLISEHISKYLSISDTKRLEWISIATKSGISEVQVDEWISRESQKLRVVKILGLEQITQLEEVQHPKLGRVARKIMKEQYASDKYERTKFFNECKAISQLDHPHIAKVVSMSEENEPKLYYTAEYIEGKMLSTAMPLSKTNIKRYALQLLDALHYIHSRDIWYKTLKPKNIIIVPTNDTCKLVASGLELTDNIKQRQRQNIKDFGLILLEMFTGKTAYQAIAQVSDEKWADIIKKTSTGSAAETYKEVYEIIRDIEEMDKVKTNTTNFTFPIKKILIWLTLFVGLFLAFVFLKDKLLHLLSYSNPPDVPQMRDLPNIQKRFTGKLRLPNKKKIDIWLTIKDLKPMNENKAVFVYSVRIDSAGGDIRFYREPEKIGELLLVDKKLKLQSPTFADWEYEQDTRGKVSLKSLNIEDLYLD
ncbi:protein kinase domain-containing protein [Thermoflexibacter ruber]|uniref:non-specific serine/threonine protein kinase n=1 Tax=Thermoflexibacter ruber TaxID=1003 RepID=A0A1I2ALR7_9BACT|nr:protein kinase [Thermoflexibacter ruber]SFE44498.1 Serine/threonine protein kinase [Thermoflexibacter ruber]